jgi:hypothetical protein
MVSVRAVRRQRLIRAHAVNIRGLGVLWGYGSRDELGECLSLNFSDDTTAYLHLRKISSTMCAIGAVASITTPLFGVSSFVRAVAQ